MVLLLDSGKSERSTVDSKVRNNLTYALSFPGCVCMSVYVCAYRNVYTYVYMYTHRCAHIHLHA